MQYGLKDQKKFPIYDKSHILSAIEYFNFVDKDHEEELANNIIESINYFNMDYLINLNENNRFNKYYTESEKKEKIFPIYIVLSYTDTLAGKVIHAYTGDKFSHASISFDNTLESLYSYNMASKLGRFGGLSFESLSSYIKYNKDSKLAVLAVFVKERDFNNIKANLEYFISNQKDTTYSFSAIFDIMTNNAKDYKNNLSMICSQFVDSLFKLANIDFTNKSSNIVTPGDLYKVKNPKVYNIFDGLAIDYDKKEIDKKIKKLMKNNNICIKENIITEKIFNTLYESYSNTVVEPIFENKQFPIAFNNNGDLIIKKWNKLDIKEEYYKSCKLIKLYKKSNNIGGLKYEASKLWFFSNILQEKISKNQNTKENIKLRAKVINTFSQTITYIIKEDKDFNFIEYYNESPFSDVSIQIDNNTIQHSLNILKFILK